MRQLHENHLADLRRSGINDESIEACGLYSASAETAGALIGMSVGSGLVFPFPGTADEAGRKLERIKLDKPLPCNDGKTMKYASPTKATYPPGNRLYRCALLGPEVLADPRAEIFITEGEKKAIKACQEGFPTIGLSGVWNWKARDEQGRSATIADLDLIDFRGRSVGIVFDSDAVTNKGVLQAEKALFDELQARGARPFTVRLPAPKRHERGRWGKKFGLDDLMVARGAAEFRFLVEWWRNPLPLGCRSVSVLEFQPLRDRPWLVEGVWKIGDCGFFAGAPKTMKSLLAMDLAIAVATGQPFFDREVAKGAVIVVDEETNLIEFRIRLEELAAGRGLSLSDLQSIHFVEKGKLKLDREETLIELSTLCDIMGPKLLILDPFVRLHEKDENSSQEVSRMLGKLRAVSDSTEVSILVVHHFKKGAGKTAAERMRGTGDLYGWLDAAIFFERKGDHLELEFEYRYGEPVEKFAVKLETDAPGSVRWTLDSSSPATTKKPSSQSLEERLFEVLMKGPMKKTEIRDALKMSSDKITGILERAESRGIVRSFVGESQSGPKPTLFELTEKARRIRTDNIRDPKGKEAVPIHGDTAPRGPDGIAGPAPSPAATDRRDPDFASALTGYGLVRNAPSALPEPAPFDAAEPAPGADDPDEPDGEQAVSA